MATNDSQPPKGHKMSEDSAIRLRSRHSHMDVFKQVQNAKRDFGNKTKKVKPAMYLHPVGQIPDFQRFPNSKKFDSETVEQYLENAILYEDAAQLMEKRQEFAVIEDDFGPALEKMLKGGNPPSLENPMNACSEYDESNDITTHNKKSQATYGYFVERGVSEDDARAYAFAIAFYTGAYSALVSMEANVFARRLMTSNELNMNEISTSSNAAMIILKGLSHIDFYWGTVVRYVKLEPKDLEDYQTGEIVTWLQFSSADKGGKDMSYFKDRNTIFIISSLTGRSIQYFSNCGDDEDEVLFLPHSSFLVCQVKYNEKERKNYIYLRQIELGFSKYVVLWVDDNIFDADWENKRHMEKASTLGTRVNVHFIPKSNTESALTFLRSTFGKRLKDSDTFRIVTDMKRTNESSPRIAGALLLREVRKLGFNQSCLIFTGHEESAYEKLNQVFGTKKLDGIKVTQEQSLLEKFVLFKRN
ncbi:unnamed protein product [Rotaria magnacalcarata]|uniref:NAD(P)(+)--arginine ADP-ribosyltransferase n=1 Tax=Rotaria magnacalcarata TaxID=392030 RepID=A0A816M4N5_9BILA|nr:unnamed protein product [Rotaria magnacalcarata]